MRCKACGVENANDATICASCGKRIGGSAGVQVWPKDASRLTEFKPTDQEKEALERVRDRLSSVISAIEENGDVEPALTVEPQVGVVAPVEEAAEQVAEPVVGRVPEQHEEPIGEVLEPAEPAMVALENHVSEYTCTEEGETPQIDEASDLANSAGGSSGKVNRLIIGVIATAIVVAAIIGIALLLGQQANSSSSIDVQSYAGEWVLVEGDDPSLSRSNIADLKTRGLEYTLLLKDDGTGSLVFFDSSNMVVEWSIDQEAKKAVGTAEGASTFDLQLTDNGITLVDNTGKSMYFERK